jgi:large subunit ribosomal protein L17
MLGHRKLNRETSHRKALLRNIVSDVLLYERIETTMGRAKEAKKIVDKMITLGKKGDLAARRRALSYIYDEGIVEKLFSEIAVKYQARRGGYTRLLKLGPRRGDTSEMVYLELV